ncbi:MAG TPA: fumarylacetoacetate hydrolase family protein [Gammaproteobacteria bacterium]|nr:fumarylacetoacetate hydrolase family protein [Gammaproteobacteria bacterium]
MKLATLKEGGRDGTLVVVSRDLRRGVRVPHIAPTLQSALEHWNETAPALGAVYDALLSGQATDPFAIEPDLLASPLPRSYQFADGSAYLNHVQLVRKARDAQMPESFWNDPLMYQGGSDSFLGPRDPIPVRSEDWGIDFEGEVGVITGDVSMGIDADAALDQVRLLLLINDVSLRNLVPGELAKGFGFFQSKPASSFSPVAVTPDELGDAWHGGRVHLPLTVHLNGEKFGEPEGGPDMVFHFGQLIAHAARTRRLEAGTIVGSGTISNPGPDGGPGRPIRDGGVGYSCIAELRTVEKLLYGESRTPFMRFGDRVRLEMSGRDGRSIFGAIDQVIEQYRE